MFFSELKALKLAMAFVQKLFFKWMQMNFTMVGIQMAAHFMLVTKFASTSFTLILMQEGYYDHKHANIDHFFKVIQSKK